MLRKRSWGPQQSNQWWESSGRSQTSLHFGPSACRNPATQEPAACWKKTKKWQNESGGIVKRRNLIVRPISESDGHGNDKEHIEPWGQIPQAEFKLTVGSRKSAYTGKKSYLDLRRADCFICNKFDQFVFSPARGSFSARWFGQFLTSDHDTIKIGLKVRVGPPK